MDHIKIEKFAVIATGGKQYIAVPGKTVAIEKIEGEAGTILEFDALFRKEHEGSLEIGTPFLASKVTASIIKQMKEPKVISFTFKRRKKVHVKKGHRQPKTVIRIETI